MDALVVIKERIEAIGISQKKLSEVTGIPPSQLSRYLNGHQSPSIGKLILILDALYVDAKTRARILGAE